MAHRNDLDQDKALGEIAARPSRGTDWLKTGTTIASSIVAITVVVNFLFSIFGGSENRITDQIYKSEQRLKDRIQSMESRIEKRFDRLADRLEKQEDKLNESNERIARVEGQMGDRNQLHMER